MENFQAPNTLNPAEDNKTSALPIVIAILILIFAIGFGIVYYAYKGIFYQASESEIRKAEQDILAQLNETYDSDFTLKYRNSGYSSSGDSLILYREQVYFSFEGKSSLDSKLTFTATCIRSTKNKDDKCKLTMDRNEYKNKVSELLKDKINSKKSEIETRLGITGTLNKFGTASIEKSFAPIIEFKGQDIQDIPNLQAIFELNDIIEDIETENTDIIDEHKKAEPDYFVAIALRFNSYDIIIANQKVFIKRNFGSDPVRIYTPEDIQNYITTSSN